MVITTMGMGKDIPQLCTKGVFDAGKQGGRKRVWRPKALKKKL